MLLRKKIFIFIAGCFTLMYVWGCKKSWDDHSKITDPSLSRDLLQQVQQEPSLSKFNELLVKSGYDKVIASSRVYTVWAPNDQALAGLDPAIVNDSVKLRQFVGNHIVTQAYYTNTPSPLLRIKTLNGKYVQFSADHLEDAAIVKANEFVNNGVLHIINKPVTPLLNIREYLNTTSYVQKDHILSLDYEGIDSAKAEQIGVDPFTGNPIYKPGTGIIHKNLLFDKTGDPGNEDEQYTFILLTDAALEAERDKLRPYTQSSTTDSTELLASLYVLKDLMVKGVYAIDELPDTLVSAFNVKVPIDKNAILETHKTSNGIVYVMSSADVKLAHRILPIVQEGETPTGFSRTDKSGNIAYRLRKNPVTAELFNDIYIYNHKVPLFNVRYLLHDVYSIKYKVYWVAPNDVQTLTFKQRLAFADPTSALFPETTVNLKNYDPVYLGEYTPAVTGNLDMFVVAANNGVDQTNSINIDYIRLVPEF